MVFNTRAELGGKIAEERASWRDVQAGRVHPSRRGGANRGRFPRFVQRELEPRPARQWLSKQNLPSGILAPPVVGHPRRRGAKDDRDETQSRAHLRGLSPPTIPAWASARGADPCFTLVRPAV